MKRFLILFLLLSLLPSLHALYMDFEHSFGPGFTGEEYKVRHIPDYERFLNAFEPYKADFLRELRRTRHTIYDGRLRKNFALQSVSDEWLLQILHDKNSRDWNKIQLPFDVLQYGLGTVTESASSPSIQIQSGASLQPSFTKHRTGGTLLPSKPYHEEQFEVSPEEIQWVRLFRYSLRNPITGRNVRVATLTDEQIASYLRSRATRKIVRIDPVTVQQDLNSLRTYYVLYRRPSLAKYWTGSTLIRKY